MELKTLLAILWKRKWIILGVSLLVAPPVFFIASVLPGFYEASARFMITDQQSQSALLSDLGFRQGRGESRSQDELGRDGISRFYAAHAVVHRRDVVDDLGRCHVPW